MNGMLIYISLRSKFDIYYYDVMSMSLFIDNTIYWSYSHIQSEMPLWLCLQDVLSDNW